MDTGLEVFNKFLNVIYTQITQNEKEDLYEQFGDYTLDMEFFDGDYFLTLVDSNLTEHEALYNIKSGLFSYYTWIGGDAEDHLERGVRQWVGGIVFGEFHWFSGDLIT